MASRASRSVPPARPAAALDPRVWRLVAHLAAWGLLGCGFLAALSLAFPEGRLTAPTEAALRRALGITAPLAPLWLCLAGLLGIWRGRAAELVGLWPRLAGLGLSSLAAPPGAHLAAAALSGGIGAETPTAAGGWVGAALASMLVYALGGTAALVFANAVLALGGMLTLRLSPARLAAGGLALARFGLQGARLLGRVAAAVASARPVRRACLWVGQGLRWRLRAIPARPGLASDAPAAARPSLPSRFADRAPEVRWALPPLSLFRPGSTVEPSPVDLRQRARVIEETLASFNIEARVVEVNPGPAVTQFGLEPAPGVAVNRVLARSNDLALRLGASPIRLEAPVPGKRVIGLEVPNTAVATVTIRDLLESEEFKRVDSRLRLALGRDVSGRPVVGDLARMPHLLIAGATGSGKSVCINTVIASLLVQSTPDELQMLMIDPKMVELVGYAGTPHLRMPVVTDMDKVVGALKWAVREMERRYSLFAGRAARNLEAYNRAVAAQTPEARLPFLVIVIDELADMMMTAADEVERTLCRLAQLGRAAGIHLVVATQRPSVDVLTGLIKANFVTRIAFAVSAQVDSRVILDTAGAEKLLGRGDMLYLPADASKPIRLQGAYVSDQEIQDLVAFWKRLGAPRYGEDEVEELSALGRGEDEEDDELYERARELARLYARVSVSLLQRRLGIGYPRAARLLDLLEERGVVTIAPEGRSREAAVQTSASAE